MRRVNVRTISGMLDLVDLPSLVTAPYARVVAEGARQRRCNATEIEHQPSRMPRRVVLRVLAATGASVLRLPHLLHAAESPTLPKGIVFERHSKVITYGVYPASFFEKASIYHSFGSKGVFMVDPATAQVRPVFESQDIGWSTSQLSPNGRLLSYATRQRTDAAGKELPAYTYGMNWRWDTLRVRNLQTGDEASYDIGKRHLHRYTWSPDSRRLALRLFEGATLDLDPRSENATYEVETVRLPVQLRDARLVTERKIEWASYLPTFSPDGRLMAYAGSGDAVVFVTAGATGTPYRTGTDAPGVIVRWSPDGKKLLVNGARGEEQMYYGGKRVGDLAIGEVEKLLDDSLAVRFPMTRGQQGARLVGIQGAVPCSATWAPNSKFVAYLNGHHRSLFGYDEGKKVLDYYNVCVFDIETGKSMQLTTHGRLSPVSVSFQPPLHWDPTSSKIAYAELEKPLVPDQLADVSNDPIKLGVTTISVANPKAAPVVLTRGEVDFVIGWC